MPREATITVSAIGVTSQTVTVTQVEASPKLLDQSWRTLLQSAINSNPTNSYSNGDRFKGQIAEGTRNGLGVYYWGSGSFYAGEWKDGNRNGFGIYIVQDIEVYYTTNCPNCRIYAGNWLSGLKEGTGACYDKNGVRIYSGEFKDDKPVGTYPAVAPDYNYTFKITKADDGSYYLVEHNQGRRSGRGIILYQNKDMWYGPWQDGIRSGYGMLAYEAGPLRLGTWKGDSYTP